MVIAEYVHAFLSGLVLALVSWLPVDPVHTTAAVLGERYGYEPYIGSAYLGIMFSVLYWFRWDISTDLTAVLRGNFTPRFQYVLFGTLFSLLIGFPIMRTLGGLEKISDILNIAVSLFILFAGVLWPKVAPLKEIEYRLPSRPTLLDSLIAGLLQGTASIDVLSRTGFVTAGLSLLGHEAKEILKLGFILAPAYHFLVLLDLGNCGSSTVLLNLISSATAFFMSLAVMAALIKGAERIGTRRFLILFGLVGVLIELGVIL